MGIHQCVGQHIARLEAEALLTALSERVELIGEPRRHHNNTMRAWRSLPLRGDLQQCVRGQGQQRCHLDQRHQPR
jgi:cytochrome P450